MRDQFRGKIEALILKRDLVAIVPKRKKVYLDEKTCQSTHDYPSRSFFIHIFFLG